MADSNFRVYHATTLANADAIEAQGFRDTTGSYYTSTDHSGVWVSDRPMNEGDGPGLVAWFQIDVDKATLAGYEWIEEGKPYREWLIPAALVNTWPMRRIDEDQMWDIVAPREA